MSVKEIQQQDGPVEECTQAEALSIRNFIIFCICIANGCRNGCLTITNMTLQEFEYPDSQMSYRTYACDSLFQHLVDFYVNNRNWLHYGQSVDFPNYGEFLSLWNESNLGSLSPERIDFKWAGWYMERWCGIWGMIVWYRVYVIHGVWGVRDIWSMVVIYGVVVWYTTMVSMGHSWSHLVWNGLNIANMVSIWVAISSQKLNWTYLVSISLILSGYHMALPTMV